MAPLYWVLLSSFFSLSLGNFKDPYHAGKCDLGR